MNDEIFTLLIMHVLNINLVLFHQKIKPKVTLIGMRTQTKKAKFALIEIVIK